MSSVVLVRSPLVALAVFLMATPSHADTLKVPADFETFQAAGDAAGLGDTVLVSKGTYNENVALSTAGIVLKGKKATIHGGFGIRFDGTGTIGKCTGPAASAWASSW